MEFATEAPINDTFNRETFNTKDDVESYIEARNQEIEYARKKLYALAIMTEPQKYCGNDSEPLSWVEDEFNECIELLEIAYIKKSEAKAVLNSWDFMHDKEGYLIENKEDFEKPSKVIWRLY